MDSEEITQCSPDDSFSQGKTQTNERFIPLSASEWKRYSILEELGRGGMGVVHKAIDTKLEMEVALKVIQSQHENSIKRFLREAATTAKLDHPAIVRFYEVGEDPAPYFTMEYIDGWTLDSYCRQPDFPVAELVNIFVKISQGLGYAHQQGVLHRDIKPQNIMITKNGEPKIMDFGLAKSYEESANLSQNYAVGTLLYMAPEQLDHSATEKSDIYSLGATFYQCLTGRPVFQAHNQLNLVGQLVNRHPIPPRELNPDISPYLEAICLKCIAKSPYNRYKDCTALVQDLENFQQRKPIIARRYSHWDKVKYTISNNRALFAFLGLFIAALITMVTVVSIKNAHIEQLNINLTNTNQKLEQQVKLTTAKIHKLEEVHREREPLLEAISESLQWLTEQEDHGHAVLHGGFRQPLLKAFQNSHGLIAAHEYTFFRQLLFDHDKHKSTEELNSLIQQYSEAIKKYETEIQDLSHDPHHKERLDLFRERLVTLRGNRGKTWVESGEYQEAMGDFGYITDSEKNQKLYPEVYNHRGKLFYLQQKYDAALKDLDIAIQAKEDNAEAYTERGFVFFQLKKFDKARKNFDKAISMNPEYAAAYHKRGLLHENHDEPSDKKALEDYEKVIKLHPHHPYGYAHRGLLYHRLKKYRQAFLDFRKAIELHTKDAEVYGKTGALYSRMKKYKKAVACWKKAEELGLRKWEKSRKKIESLLEKKSK